MQNKTLREVCASCGVSRRAVQGYEKCGLVKPTGRTSRGYLLYDRETEEQILHIKQLQSFGFSLKEVKSYLCEMSSKEKLIALREKLERLRNQELQMVDFIMHADALRESLKEMNCDEFYPATHHEEIQNNFFRNCLNSVKNGKKPKK